MFILAQTSTATAVQETVNTLIQGGAISIALVLSFIVLLMVGIAWRYAPRLFDAVMAFFDKVNAFTKTLTDTIASLQRLNEQSHAALTENTTITKNVVQSNERIESAVNANNTIATQTAATIDTIKADIETVKTDISTAKTLLDSAATKAQTEEIKQLVNTMERQLTDATGKLTELSTQLTTISATLQTVASRENGKIIEEKDKEV